MGDFKSKTCNKICITKTKNLLLEENLDVSEDLIEEVVRSQDKFSIEKIREGNFEDILYPYLGKFKADQAYIKKYKENKKDNER